MAFRIPPQQIVGIKALLELPDDKVAEFLTVLRDSEPYFNTDDLSDHVEASSSVPRRIAYYILEVLSSLYLTLDAQRPVEDVATFLDQEIFPSLKAAEAFSPDNVEEQWKKLRAFFFVAVSLESSIGTTAKAGPVLTEHERIFNGVKIMTDLRPIFDHDVTEPPTAALIVHMVKITQRDRQSNETDFFFALDSNDLRTLQEALERAAQKEETLRKIMNTSGVKVLDVRLTY